MSVVSFVRSARVIRFKSRDGVGDRLPAKSIIASVINTATNTVTATVTVGPSPLALGNCIGPAQAAVPMVCTVKRQLFDSPLGAIAPHPKASKIQIVQSNQIL
jgi:DNA-binding beta-propeller fold protein YncE